MESYNVARITFTVITGIVALILFLIKSYCYKDKRIEENEMILLHKRNYERKIVDAINVIVSWVIFSFGVAQPWHLLEYSTLLGTAITLLVGLLPIGIFGSFFFGFYLQKNDFDYLLILDADVEDKIFKLMTVEYFVKDGVKYIKADNIRDAVNENFVAVLIDVERDRFWKAQLDDAVCEPVFVDDIQLTEDKIEIQTYIRDGAIITKELLDSKDEREIHMKDSLSNIIKDQEEEIMSLEDENNYLKAQRRKGINELTAKRWAVIQQVLQSCERTLPEKDLADLQVLEEEEISVLLGEDD